MQHLDCQSVQLCLRQASGFPIDDNSRCRHSPFAQLSANEALNQLKEWEPLIEFWQILIGEIFTDRVNCSMELRWIAVIYCKNTVDRNWRRLKSQQNIDEAIIKPMKEGIRDTLVSATLQESTEKLATQASIVIAKILRMDFQPQIIEQLAMAAADSHQPLLAERGGQTLLQCVKSLASRSLPAQRRQFQQLARQLFPSLSQLFETRSRQLVSDTDNSATVVNAAAKITTTMTLLKSNLSMLKSLRYLLIHGFTHLTDPSIGQLLTACYQHILAPGIALLSRSLPTYQLWLKSILQVGKLLLQLNDQLPADLFRLPVYPQIILPWYMSQLATSSGAQVLAAVEAGRCGLDRFFMQCMNLIRQLILLPNQVQLRNAEDPVPLECLNRLLPPQSVYQLVELVVTRYMSLTEQQDLRQWAEQPFHWLGEDDLDAPDCQLRPCAERLVRNLCSLYCCASGVGDAGKQRVEKVDLINYLVHSMLPAVSSVITVPTEGLSSVNDKSSLSPTLSLDRVCLLDAAFSVLGLAADWLVDALDFDHWLLSYLLPLASSQAVQQHPNTAVFAIINRRICLLIGSWVNTPRCSASTRPAIYAYLNGLLQLSNSFGGGSAINFNYMLVVRITAALQLRYAVDDWQFDPADFEPFQRSLLTGVLSLLQLHSNDSIDGAEGMPVDLLGRLVAVVSVVVERMADRMADDAYLILQTLQQIWLDMFSAASEATGSEQQKSAVQDDSFNSFPLQSALLNCFKAILPLLAARIDSENNPYMEFLSALIRYALTTQSPQFAYLSEDGLELWLTLLKHAPDCLRVSALNLLHALLLHPQTGLFALGGSSSENLNFCLRICQYTLLLVGAEEFSASCSRRIFDSSVEIIILSSSSNWDAQILWPLVDLMDLLLSRISSNHLAAAGGDAFFLSLINSCLRNDASSPEQLWIILARFLLHHPDLFVQWCLASAIDLPTVIDRWLRCGGKRMKWQYRKLFFMAILTLLSPQLTAVVGGVERQQAVLGYLLDTRAALEDENAALMRVQESLSPNEEESNDLYFAQDRRQSVASKRLADARSIDPVYLQQSLQIWAQSRWESLQFQNSPLDSFLLNELIR